MWENVGCIHNPQIVGVHCNLGYLKTAIDGTCHGFKYEKYAHCNLCRDSVEIQWRFNGRFDLRRILPRLIRVAVSTAIPQRYACDWLPED